MKAAMKTIGKILLHYVAIPFAICFGHVLVPPIISVINIPVLTALAYFLFRRKFDMRLAAITNGIAALVQLTIFTVLLAVASGNVESSVMSNYHFASLPFLPVFLAFGLTESFRLLFALQILTYFMGFLASIIFGKVRIRLRWLWAPVALAIGCMVVSACLYSNRPAVRYAGHGFDYMNGYSSTDLSDYMVNSPNCKLATLDEEPSLSIEGELRMPVLDGAEACYPLYAAFAKAVYRDIDKIETSHAQNANSDRRYNGHIVTFSNSVRGFERMALYDFTAGTGNQVDLFFGARPSAMQMDLAEMNHVELEVTPIAEEAFVFFVEKDNPIENLTSEQLKAIYHGDITNWSQLGGADQEVRAFQRPENSGSQTMMEYFMGDVSLKEPMTYERVSAMEGVIEEVAQYTNEGGAIGYSFRYFIEELNQEEGVKMLSVDGVYPSLENIQNGTYPLTTNVCMISRKDNDKLNLQQMKDFILSEQGQELVKKTGYAPLKTE